MTPEERDILTRPVESLEDIARLYFGPDVPPAVMASAQPPQPRRSVAHPVLSDDELYSTLFGRS